MRAPSKITLLKTNERKRPYFIISHAHTNPKHRVGILFVIFLTGSTQYIPPSSLWYLLLVVCVCMCVCAHMRDDRCESTPPYLPTHLHPGSLPPTSYTRTTASSSRHPRRCRPHHCHRRPHPPRRPPRQRPLRLQHYCPRRPGQSPGPHRARGVRRG